MADTVVPIGSNQPPPQSKRLQYQAKTGDFRQPLPRMDSWIPWSEPVRQKIAPALAIALATASGLIAPILNPNTQITQKYESRWHQPWSEPQRPLKKGIPPHLIAASGLFAPVLNPNTQITTKYESKWHQPWSEPVRIKRPGIGPEQQDFAADFPQNITSVTTSVDRWYVAFVDPIRPKRFDPAQQDIAADFSQYNPVQVNPWYQPWSEPVRIRRFDPAQQDIAADFSQYSPPQLESSWHQSWSEPVRTLSGLKQYLHDAPFWSTYTPVVLPPGNATAAVTVVSNQPPIQIKSLQYQAQSFVPLVSAPAPTVALDWLQPLSQRPFSKTSVSSYQSTAFVPVVTAAPTVSLGWLQPLSQKPSDKITVSDATFTFMTVDNALTNMWYAPWADMVRRGYWTAQQVAFAWGNTTPAAVVFTDTRWYAPLSEPVRTRQLATAQQPFLSYTRFLPTPASFLEGWYSAFSEPVRQKQGLSAQQQQTQAWSTFTPVPEVITVDKWYQLLAEPVRFRRLDTAQQQGVIWAANKPIISFGYYGWLSEPVRQKPGLGVALQRETTIAPSYPILSRLIAWLKPFDEPVRTKPGLLAWLQQVFTAGTTPLANPVFVTMSAQETSKDIAQFSATVYNAPAKAYVSIEEIQP